jgi:hypothetical protein
MLVISVLSSHFTVLWFHRSGPRACANVAGLSFFWAQVGCIGRPAPLDQCAEYNRSKPCRARRGNPNTPEALCFVSVRECKAHKNQKTLAAKYYPDSFKRRLILFIQSALHSDFPLTGCVELARQSDYHYLLPENVSLAVFLDVIPHKIPYQLASCPILTLCSGQKGLL